MRLLVSIGPLFPALVRPGLTPPIPSQTTLGGRPMILLWRDIIPYLTRGLITAGKEVYGDGNSNSGEEFRASSKST